MVEKCKTSWPKPVEKRDTSLAARLAPSRLMTRAWVLSWLCAGLICGVSPHAQAGPAGEPTKNRIFYNCTFTAADLQSIQSILNISESNLDLLNNGTLQASYILIYVTGNPNDGQKITPPTPPDPPQFTGPILCTNSDTDDIIATTEAVQIPDPTLGASLVNIVGAEEVSHLQYEPVFGTPPTTTLGDTEKRVCHTVASNTDCFFIRPFSTGD